MMWPERERLNYHFWAYSDSHCQGLGGLMQGASQVALVVKNLLANEGDAGDEG